MLKRSCLAWGILAGLWAIPSIAADEPACPFSIDDLAHMLASTKGSVVLNVIPIPDGNVGNQIVLYVYQGTLSYAGARDGCLTTAGTTMVFPALPGQEPAPPLPSREQKPKVGA